MVASAIAFWMNELLKPLSLEKYPLFLVSALIEEIAKYLAIRNNRSYSLAIPVIFLINEAAVQAWVPPFIQNSLTIWIFSILLGLPMLKHTLFYIPMYLFDYKLCSLPIAIILHLIWNWYADTPKGADTLSLSIISLLVIILPAMALYRWRRKNDLA